MWKGKGSSPDSVWGLGYYCCIEGGLLGEKIMSCWEKIKKEQKIISPPPRGNCFLLLLA
jgi:hypothetical protein